MPTEPSSDEPAARERHDVRNAALTLLLVALAATAYYLLPAPGRMHGASWLVLFCSGIVVLAALIVTNIMRLLRYGPQMRIGYLVFLICIAVLFFAWANATLAKQPGQFVDLHTKTDSLYFSISTLATVGFGDVHAAGQLARMAVTLEILFNLVFLGVVVATVSAWVRSRASARLHRPRDRSD